MYVCIAIEETVTLYEYHPGTTITVGVGLKDAYRNASDGNLMMKIVFCAAATRSAVSGLSEWLAN